jgi:hypothetical protein
VVHADHRVKVDSIEIIPRVIRDVNALHSAGERWPAGGIRGTAASGAGGEPEVSFGSIIATIPFSRTRCGKLGFERSGKVEGWSQAHA